MASTSLVKKKEKLPRAITPGLVKQEKAYCELETYTSDNFSLKAKCLESMRFDEEWKRSGFKAWSAYCNSNRLPGVSYAHYKKLVAALRIKEHLPDLPKLDPDGSNGMLQPYIWTEWIVRSFVGLTPRQIETAARKFIEAVEAERCKFNAPAAAKFTKPYKKKKQAKTAKPDDEATVIAAFKKVVEQQFDLLSGWDMSQWRKLEKADPGATEEFARLLREYAQYILD